MRTFTRYTLTEYVDKVLRPAVGKFNFSGVHVHATWKPTIADFRKSGGLKLCEAMYRAHLQRGFVDIAQHVTIDPDGYIWDGRSLSLAPASATGYNGSASKHPFMFEMIGNFDKGQEKLEGAQLETSVGLTRAVLQLWKLPESAMNLHREFTNQKTCPGSGIDKGWFLELVRKGDDEMKALEEVTKLAERVAQLEKQSMKVTAPSWFVKEWGSADLGGLILDPNFTPEGWRTVASVLRAIGWKPNKGGK